MIKYKSNRKYGNQKVTVNGITFDSKKEANRYCELLLLEKSGAISNLQLQVKFLLIPTQREECTEEYKRGKRKGQPKPGRVLENECSYLADFYYIENGNIVVEDTKGVRTKDYIIKRKLMLQKYGIRIKEI